MYDSITQEKENHSSYHKFFEDLIEKPSIGTYQQLLLGGKIEPDQTIKERVESCLDNAFIEKSESMKTIELESGVNNSSRLRRTSSNRLRDEDLIDNKSVKSNKKRRANRLAPVNLQIKPQAAEQQFNNALCTKILKTSSILPPGKTRFLREKGVKNVGAHMMIDSFILLETIGQGSWSDEVFLAYDTIRETKIVDFA
jgi:hypothetical protein